MNQESMDLFVSILPQLGYAILGIFIVAGIIIGTTMILNLATKKKSK